MTDNELTYEIRGAIFAVTTNLGQVCWNPYMKKLWYMNLSSGDWMWQDRSKYLSSTRVVSSKPFFDWICSLMIKSLLN